MKAISLAVVVALTFAALPAASAEEVRVSRSSWVSEMRNLLPAAFCQEGSYFRSCFTVDASTCLKTANATADICMKQYESQIPATLAQPHDGQFWGQKVGSCAGNLYEQRLASIRTNTDKCNNPANWQ